MAVKNSVEKFRAFFGRILSVKVIQHLEDDKSFEESLTTSNTIAGMIGEALGADVVEIEIVPLTGAIAYNTNDTAVAGTNARILQGVPYLLTGDTTKLNAAQFVQFLGGPVSVSIITRKLVTG